MYHPITKAELLAVLSMPTPLSAVLAELRAQVKRLSDGVIPEQDLLELSQQVKERLEQWAPNTDEYAVLGMMQDTINNDSRLQVRLLSEQLAQLFVTSATHYELWPMLSLLGTSAMGASSPLPVTTAVVLQRAQTAPSSPVMPTLTPLTPVRPMTCPIGAIGTLFPTSRRSFDGAPTHLPRASLYNSR